MLLPALTYGIADDVKKRCSRIITKLKRGTSWEDATAGPMIDTAEHPGLIVLNGPSPLLRDAPHFHVYVPLQELLHAMLPRRGRLPASARDAIFSAALEHDWSTLSLQGRANQSWLIRPETHEPFLRATLRSWGRFDVEPRYTAGSTEGTWLWACNPMIQYVLANLGVPQEALRTVIRTADELEALVAAHGLSG